MFKCTDCHCSLSTKIIKNKKKLICIHCKKEYMILPKDTKFIESKVEIILKKLIDKKIPKDKKDNFLELIENVKTDLELANILVDEIYEHIED